MVEITAKSDGLDRELKRASRSADSFGRSLKSAFSVAGGILLAKAVSEVGRAVGGMAKAGLDFEAGMANVNSIAQLSSEELGKLSDRIINLANDPRITDGPAALAEGLYNIYSSGFQGADALNILQSSAMAATAGLTSTDVAAAAATAVLNAYGMSADEVSHVNDVMFQTVNDGVITYEELAKNLGNTIPIAASLGITIEELGAAYAQLTLQGQNASAAETNIAGLMRATLNPTEELTAAVGKLGYDTVEAFLKAQPPGMQMVGLLDLLEEASGGSDAELRKLVGTDEALRAVQALLTKGTGGYIKELNRMKRSSEGVGATQRALKKQMESTRYQMALAKKEFQVVGAVLMGMLAPGIGFAAEKLAGFARGIAVFLHYIDMVLDGHSRWTKSLDLLPDGFQRAARGIGLVVDAIADLYRAFQKGGIQGFMDELDRVQGDRLISGLKTIAEEAWKAFSDTFGTLAQIGLDLGVIAVKATFELAKDVVTNIWEWFKGKLGLGGAYANVGDGTQQTNNGEPITLGTVLVTAALKLGGQIAEWAGDLWGWVKEQLGVGGGTTASGFPGMGGSASGGQTIDLGTVTVSISGWLIESTASLASKIADFVSGHKAGSLAAAGLVAGGFPVASVLITIKNWEVISGAAESLGTKIGNLVKSISAEDVFNAGAAAGVAIRQGVGKIVQEAINVGEFLGDLDWSKVPGKLAEGLVTGLKVAAIGTAAIAAAIGLFIAGAVTGIVLGPEVSFDDVAAQLSEKLHSALDAVFGSPGGFKIDPNSGRAVSAEGLLGGLSPSMITDALHDIFDNLDFGFITDALDGVGDAIKAAATPTLPGWMTDTGWIDSAVATFQSAWDKIVDLKNKIAGEANGPPSSSPTYHTGPPQPSSQPGNVGGEPVTTLPNVGSGPTTVTVKVVTDLTEFHAGINEALGTGQAFAGMTFTPKISGETSLFNAAINDALGTGQTWDGMTFTSDISGDTAMFNAAINDALGTGQTWDGMTFTADINANDNASGVINSVINGLNSIPSVKTVTINTVNTSSTIPARARGGLVSEALTWVGEQGPELVSLPRGSYVHTSGQSRSMANGMRNTGAAFAQATNGSGGGNTYNITVQNAYTLEDFKDQMAEAAAVIISDSFVSEAQQQRRGQGAR